MANLGNDRAGLKGGGVASRARGETSEVVVHVASERPSDRRG